MARLLADRDVGDPGVDALVLLAMVDAFGVVVRRPGEVEAVAGLIERGFLGRL
jgi:hypothetical protein